MLTFPVKSIQAELLRIPTCARYIHFKNTERDYYEILEVSRNSSAAEIKQAFYKKSKEIHPDNCPLDSATAQFVELKKAYDVLRRPADRTAYDNRGRKDYHNMYGRSTYSYKPPHGYDTSDDWRRFWQQTERSNYTASEAKKKSEDQWRVIFQWTAFGTFLVILYNLGYVLQVYYRDYQLSKLLDEDEIANSFLRQKEFSGQIIDDIERGSLAKMLKADVDEAWRRRQEELRGRNKDEIREEYRWLKAVQDAEHNRKIKLRRAELRRHELEMRWKQHSSKPPPEEPQL